MLFQQTVGGIGKLLCIIAEMTQVRANKRQLSLSWIYFFYPAYSLNRFLLKYIATKTVNGICCINDYSTLQQDIHDRSDVSWLGIIRMNMNQHL